MRTRFGRAAFGFALLITALAGLAMLVKGLYPADLPASRDPDFVDNIFDNRGVVWAARLLLVSAAAVLAFGGIFIFVSIGIRMKNGEWLRRAGPFEISEGDLKKSEDEVEFWCRAALTSREEAAVLREQLEQFDESLGNLHDPR